MEVSSNSERGTTMSRRKLSLNLILGLVALAASSLASAQYKEPGVMTSITNSGANDNKLIDLSVSSVNDPKEINLLFKEGDEITSILDGLNKKGFHIEYKKKHFQPTMTLVAIPTATQIDDVLREILEPWNFRVYRNPLGKVIVTPVDPKNRKVDVVMQDKGEPTG